ncbi:peptide/nickel transport system permease protein [Streptosporangium becharense]|uniref:Peptide/nickel transport system permease protein n=1 Tax=Streptosporangium becharense TaxID=1816182 RepID=A0A7W9IK63_9ACTN|nr:ABC transporter permease [Streptosporangium becharense]MBB2911012.1 peptide/nickel transport system permease protein [Streptosporangium becharense]MBB5821930.1 peptide/nickel transport system permease protein [Streptosporangium becharense]
MTLTIPALRAKSAKRRRRRPLSLVLAVALLLAVAVAGLLAPVLAPHSPDATSLSNSLLPPGTEGHWLGTDSTGRDVLSRLMHGARLSLLAPLGVVLLSGLLGTAAGLLAARAGGWADAVISRGMDIAFAFPSLLLAMLAVAVFGPGLTAPICALAVSYTPFIGRVVRSVAMQEGTRPYMESYRVMGFGELRMTLRHLLPNVLPVLIAQSALSFGYALVDLASLSYLGLGVRPPDADWGSMISQERSAILQGAPWSGLLPGLAVLLTVVSVNVLGEHIGAFVGGKRSEGA